MQYLREILETIEPEKKNNYLRSVYDEAYKGDDYAPCQGYELLRQLFKLAPPSCKTFLDVGCGMAQEILPLRKRGVEAWGMDFADCTHRWNEYRATPWCIRADAREIPFKDNAFDLVFCADVLEHIPEDDIERTFQELIRVARISFIFQIAYKEEMRPINGNFVVHITIKEPEWWLEKLSTVTTNFTPLNEVYTMGQELLIFGGKNGCN